MFPQEKFKVNFGLLYIETQFLYDNSMQCRALVLGFWQPTF